jgi:hypothetical protein
MDRLGVALAGVLPRRRGRFKPLTCDPSDEANFYAVLNLRAGPDEKPAPCPDGATLIKRYMATGANHACAVQGADVTCWGQNNLGQLGIGDTSNRGADRTPLAPVMFDPAR